MAFDQQALVDLFRQSFSPITDLSSGRLQLAMGQAQRDYASQQQQAQRAQALKDHVAGLEAQARLQRVNQTDAENARFEHDTKTTASRTAAALANSDLERYWRNLDEGDKALQHERDAAATAGMDPAEIEKYQDDLKGLTVARGKHVKDKTTRLSNEATDLYLSLYDAEEAEAKALAKTKLTEAERVKIVLPHALAAAGKDEKLKKALSAMTNADDIAVALSTSVEMPDVTLKRMGDALAAREKVLQQGQSAAIRAATNAANLINKQILDLPPGTTPDRAVLKKRGVPLPPPTTGGTSPAAQRMDSRRIGDLFVPGPGAAGAAAIPVVPTSPAASPPPPYSVGLGAISDVLNIGSNIPDAVMATGNFLQSGSERLMRGAIGDRGLKALTTPPSFLLPNAPAQLPRPARTIDIAGELSRDRVLGAVPPAPAQRINIPAPPPARMINIPAPPPARMINIPRSLAGLSMADHAAADPLAHINNLIAQAQDPAVAGALRAIRAGASSYNLADAFLRQNEEAEALAVPSWQY